MHTYDVRNVRNIRNGAYAMYATFETILVGWTYDDNIGPKLKKPSFGISGVYVENKFSFFSISGQASVQYHNIYYFSYFWTNLGCIAIP